MPDLPPYRRRPLYEAPKGIVDLSHRNDYAGRGQDPSAYGNPISGKKQFEQLIDLLFRRRWIVIITFFVVAIPVAVFSYLSRPDPVYQSYSLVMVDLAPAGRLQITLTPTGDDPLGRTNTTLQDELFVLQMSTLIGHRVAERLLEDPSNDSLSLCRTPGGGLLTPDQLASRLAGYVSFAPERGASNVIRISSVSPVPVEAVAIADLYAEEYARLKRELGRAGLSSSLDYLEEQEVGRRQELRDAEAQIGTYMAEHGVQGLDPSGSNAITRIASLEAQRDDARLELEMHQASLNALDTEIQRLEPQLAGRVASDVEVQLTAIRERSAALLQEKALKENRYPEGRRPAIVLSELKELDDNLERLKVQELQLSERFVTESISVGGSGESGIQYLLDLKRQREQEKTAIDLLGSRMQVIEMRLNEANAELDRMPQTSVALAQLERNRTYAEQMHQLVLARMMEVRVTEELGQGTGGARILRQASPPQFVLPSNLRRNVVLGLFFGLLAGLGLAIGRDKLDNRIFKTDQLRERGYDVIGIVPDMRPLLKEEYRNVPTIEVNGRPLSTTLVTVSSPMSAVAEGYRMLRSNIQFGSLVRAVDLRTIVVTSANMSEGKSVSAANLAIAMAQAGQSTVLVDADLRRPQVHQLLGLPLGPGLAQVLSREIPNGSIPLHDGLDNLKVLTAGRIVANSSELLASEGLPELLADLAGRFQTVIIDSPPVRAISDASILAANADGVILVSRAGETREEELEYAREMLERVGAVVLGILFNGFNVSMAYGHKYRYSQYTKYGQYTKNGYYAAAENGERRHHSIRGTLGT